MRLLRQVCFVCFLISLFVLTCSKGCYSDAARVLEPVELMQLYQSVGTLPDNDEDNEAVAQPAAEGASFPYDMPYGGVQGDAEVMVFVNIAFANVVADKLAHARDCIAKVLFMLGWMLDADVIFYIRRGVCSQRTLGWCEHAFCLPCILKSRWANILYVCLTSCACCFDSLCRMRL